MILEKEVTIQIKTNSLIQYYKNLGYDIKLKDTITIPIDHLPKGSHFEITGICAICGAEKKMMYKTYLTATKNTYCCVKCSKQKKNITMKERYGVEHALQCAKFIEKQKNTWLMNYGVDHPSKSETIKSNFSATMVEKYGVKNALENKKIKEKMFLEQIENNNGLYFFQTDDFKMKSENTCLEKYNSKYYLQSEDKSTNQKKHVLKNMVLNILHNVLKY